MQRTKYVSAYLQWISNDKGFCCWRELSMCDPSVYWFHSALLNPFTILVRKLFNIKKTDVLLCLIRIQVIRICKDSFLSELKTNIPTNSNCWFPVNDRFVNINKRRISISVRTYKVTNELLRYHIWVFYDLFKIHYRGPEIYYQISNMCSLFLSAEYCTGCVCCIFYYISFPHSIPVCGI